MQNEKQLIQKDRLLENVFAECAEDFILPDYMPEVRRVLRLETRLLPGEKFVGGGKAEFDGTVLYTLFYTDTEEKLTAVPLESRYEYRLPLDVEAGAAVYSDETIESVNLRPSGPRRVNIRSRVRAAVHEVREEPLQKDPAVLWEEEECPCLLRRSEVMRTVRAEGDGFEAIAERMLDAEAEIRPIYGSAEVLTEGARAADGHINCHGTVLIKCLAEKGEETLTLSARIPFEEELISSECREGDAVTVKGICHGVELETEEDGDRRVLHATARCSLTAEARRNEPAVITADMYSTEKNLKVAYKPLHTESLSTSFLGNFTIEADSVAEEGEEVMLASVTVRDAAVKTAGDKAAVAGECRAELLCRRAGEGFYAADFTFPFRIEAPLSQRADEGDLPRFSLTPVFTDVTVQGGKRHLSTEMALSLCLIRPSEQTVPDTVETEGERAVPDTQSVTVYYPTDKDSLWSVGKRYGMRVGELQKQNGILLSEDTALDDVKSLDGTAWLFVSRL